MKRYVIRFDALAPGDLKQWLESLTEAERQELGRLDHGSGTYGSADRADVAKDWIEEHGGLREWWKFIRTYVEEET